MRVDCVIVHYHTPELACRAVASLHGDAATSRLDVDVVLVDNGSDEEGRRRLASIAARILRPEGNLGYAGGVNLGVARTASDYVVVMNADVELIPGCLAHLIATLRAGSAAAGPRLYLDREKRFVLPPTEVHTRREELLRRLARRGDPWTRWARRSWRRHARRQWLAEGDLSTRWLNGALLAIRRDAWDAVGPFDDGYELYFEEVDWLLRLQRRGLRSTYVPRAEAFHWYNRGAGAEPRAAELFDASARRFAARPYGAAFLALADRFLAEGVDAGGAPPHRVEGIPSIALPGREARLHGPLWVELSPSPVRFPAAAALVADPGAERWTLHAEVWNGLPPGRYFLTVADTTGAEWGVIEFERTAPASPAGTAITGTDGPVAVGPSALREYVAGDEEAINRGFNAAFGLQRPLEEWRWKFAEEPRDRCILLAVDARNEVLAHIAAVPIRFQVDGKVLRAGQLVDLFCLRRPDFAHAGVYARLGREFYATFGDTGRLNLLFGFPGERSFGVGRAKLDYGDPAPVPVWRRDASTRLDSPTSHTLRQGFNAAAVDRLWQRCAARYAVASVRDAGWLTRRFTGRPGVEYVHLGAWNDDEIEAWAVLRLQDGEVRWAELVWDGRDSRAVLTLDAAADRMACQWGAPRLEMWLANDPSAEEVLARRGWLSTPHPHIVLTALSFQPGVHGNELVRRCYVTMGDADLV